MDHGRNNQLHAKSVEDENVKELLMGYFSEMRCLSLDLQLLYYTIILSRLGNVHHRSAHWRLAERFIDHDRTRLCRRDRNKNVNPCKVR